MLSFLFKESTNGVLLNTLLNPSLAPVQLPTWHPSLVHAPPPPTVTHLQSLPLDPHALALVSLAHASPPFPQSPTSSLFPSAPVPLPSYPSPMPHPPPTVTYQQSLPLGPRVLGPLAASQIHQTDLAHLGTHRLTHSATHMQSCYASIDPTAPGLIPRFNPTVT